MCFNRESKLEEARGAHTWAEDQKAYRKIFDYQSGNPGRAQTNNLRVVIFQARPENFQGLA